MRRRTIPTPATQLQPKDMVRFTSDLRIKVISVGPSNFEDFLEVTGFDLDMGETCIVRVRKNSMVNVVTIVK